MDKIITSNFLRLIETLSLELKLEILSKLTESLKKEIQAKPVNKQLLFDELSGSWGNTHSQLAEDIMNTRTISDRNISLD